jgi:hypothetical protein
MANTGRRGFLGKLGGLGGASLLSQAAYIPARGTPGGGGIERQKRALDLLVKCAEPQARRAPASELGLRPDKVFQVYGSAPVLSGSLPPRLAYHRSRAGLMVNSSAGER